MHFKAEFISKQPRCSIIGQKPLGINLTRQRDSLRFSGVQQTGLLPRFGIGRKGRRQDGERDPFRQRPIHPEIGHFRHHLRRHTQITHQTKQLQGSGLSQV